MRISKACGITAGFFCVAAALLLATITASAQVFNDAPVDALVRESLNAWDVPGAAVIVVSRDKILYLKGHGVRELGKPDGITDRTIFPIASCTKAFTTTLIGQLVDAGKLSWDDPVRKHLPDFRLADPLANLGVTIRDLLCHRTGLAGHDMLWYRSPLPMPELVRRTAFLPPGRPFRTTFQYQSLMFTAAGLAASHAAGRPWDDLIRTQLFEPLEMRSARCVTPDFTAGFDRATPHRTDASGKLESIPWYVQKEPNPAGSIHLSARDLANWLMFQLGDGTYLGRRLISPASFYETHAPHIVQRIDATAAMTHPHTVLMSYGLGWVLQDYRGTQLWTHTGVIDGFRVQIALAPRQGVGIAVLSNRHETRMNLALVNALLDRQLGLPTSDWNTYLKQVVAKIDTVGDEERRLRTAHYQAKPTLPLSEYVGRFEHPAYGPVSIESVGDGLTWSWNSFRASMKPMADNSFELTDRWLDDPVAKFQTRAGKITSFHLFDVDFVKK